MENAKLKAKIEEWLKWDKNEETLNQIKSLVGEKKFDELSKLLLSRLSFGTAGLRGVMTAGYAAMNSLVIIQTGQGFLKYLEQTHLDLLQKNGIVIGYDGRHNSKSWAELTASIFLHAGYKVHLFSDVNPTPFVPFAVRKYNCASGVMVTASHNPKDDNGYKVYGPNSAQINSPHDKAIQKSILENLEPLETSWDTSILTSSNLLHDPLEDVLESYMEIVENAIDEESKTINCQQNLIFTYTAMHGVGYKFIQNVVDRIRITIIPVVEQRDPDPNFSTVKFPNPEEGKSSLDLSFKTANENNSSIIIANDPDADRFAVAERNPISGDWKVFSGNELGALFGWWLLECYKKRNPNGSLDNVYMICSTVSSMILRTMSVAEGFHFAETLTGFKWIGNRALDFLEDGKDVIFCFEEAIGFMCGTAVIDKDGISAAAHFTTMTSYLYKSGKTIAGQLGDIYDKYGFHISCNSYYICHDQEKIRRIFDRIRNINGNNGYPTEILNGKYQIKTVRDLTTGYDNSTVDDKAILPVSKSSQMITFSFTNGLVCTLRTSGTEPKIKYYTELCATPDIKDKTVINATLSEMVKGLCEEFLQPQENGLIPKSD